MNMIDDIEFSKAVVEVMKRYSDHLINQFDEFIEGQTKYEMKQKEKSKEHKVQTCVGGDIRDEIQQVFF